jgi:hypothetical protein
MTGIRLFGALRFGRNGTAAQLSWLEFKLSSTRDKPFVQSFFTG